MINRYISSPAIVLCFFLFLFFPQVSQSAKQPQGSVVQFSAAQWQVYRNEQQGYSLRLPPEVQTIFKKKRNPEEAAQNFLPFDYVNFSLNQPGENQEPFELGLGVHLNKFNLNARRFADLKDEGVKQGVRQYVTIRSTAVTVAGIEGVRDDFALEKEYGWTTYSRIVIPVGNKFFCFLCTLGKEKAAAEYEQVFQKMIESFEIIK